MKSKILIAILVSFLAMSVVTVGMLIPAKAEAKEKANAPADNANERAKAPDLEKIEFIHWKKGTGKGKPPCDDDGICDPGEKPSCADCKNGEEEPPKPITTCYAFMGKYGKKYLKWRDELPITCVIDTEIPGYLAENFVTSSISAGVEEWDWFTTTDLFYECKTGSGTAYRDQNYVNGISFGNYYSDPDIIGACTVWYNPATKTIVEFDIIFETNYTWGDATLDPSVMDLQNIATHELGHAVGLADVYDEAECSEVTMYGYSVEGETKKRTLEEPDVIGILELYPE